MRRPSTTAVGAVLAATGCVLAAAQVVWPLYAVVYDPVEGDRSSSGLSVDVEPVRTSLWTWGRSQTEGPNLGGVDFGDTGNVLVLVGLVVSLLVGLGGAALWWWVARRDAVAVGAVGVTVAAVSVLGSTLERLGQPQVFGPGARIETTVAGHTQPVASLLLVAAVVVALWPAGRSLVLEGVGRVQARRRPEPAEVPSTGLADLAPALDPLAAPEQTGDGRRPRVGVARLDRAPSGGSGPGRRDGRRAPDLGGPSVGFSDDEADGAADRAHRHPRR